MQKNIIDKCTKIQPILIVFDKTERDIYWVYLQELCSWY